MDATAARLSSSQVELVNVFPQLAARQRRRLRAQRRSDSREREVDAERERKQRRPDRRNHRPQQLNDDDSLQLPWPVRASPRLVPKNSHGRLMRARTLGPTSAWVGGLFRVRVVDVDVDLHPHGGVGKRARGTRGASKFFTRKCVPGAPQRFRAHEKTRRTLRTSVALAVGAQLDP